MNYMQVIGTKYPNVQCYSSSTDYDSIIWVSGDALPTQSELDAHIAANPYADQPSDYLFNGLPAYFYAQANMPISIEKSTLVFSTSTTGASNYWLNCGNANGSQVGYHIDQNSIIKKVSFSTKIPINDTITLKFIQPGTDTSLLNVNIDPNVNIYSIDTSALLTSNTLLSCHLSCSLSVQDVVVTIDVAYRN